MSDKITVRAALEAGLRHHQDGQLEAAKRCYQQALAMDAAQADALHLLGVIALQSGEHETALEMISAAIAISPEFATYHCNLGNALQALERFEACAAAYAQAIQLQPDYAEAHYNHGIALMDLSRVEEALVAYEEAIALRPDNADAVSHRGRTLLRLGRVEEGVAALEAAIRLRPDYAAGYFRLGDGLLQLGRFEAAIRAYDSTLRLQPGHADAIANRGSAFMSLGRAETALAAYDAALRINPEQASAYYNRGTALQALRRYDAAIAAYETAIELKPDYTKPHSNLVMCLHYQQGNDAARILRAAQRFAAHIEPRPRASFANATTPGRRLRIGYVSGDFYRHTVTDFLLPVLANHDAACVEIFCYSNSPVADDVTDRLRAAAHHWREITGLADDAAGAKIIEDGIDILVDLSGHTNGNRLALFAGRAAPVQATWLGFWGTTGLPAMDYIISDADTIPPGQEAYFSERVRHLPRRFCYQPPDYAPVPVAPPSLTGMGTVFGSFNNLAKVTPEVISLWAQVLQAVHGSRLLLKWKTLDNAQTRQEITAAFAARGIAPQRLILRGASAHELMLAEYGDIDIALDPFPFSGGVTSCEALWMGLPVVTMPGAGAASRQTLGFLRSIGRMEWVARAPGDYIHAAAALAEDKGRLAEHRAAQRRRMAASPLCDGKMFTRQLEDAYRGMWREWCDKSAPATPIEDGFTPPQGLFRRLLRR